MPKKTRIQSLKGMHDILPRDQVYFEEVYKSVKKIAEFYGFNKISTPVLEEARLFEKATGFTTDIVEKQMYTFKSKSGKSLTLKPEGTPSIVRAYIQHGMSNLPQPVKLWSFEPIFRYEQPQASRYRQFHQFGFEVIGEGSPIIDAQIILISFNILKSLGFKDLDIEVNSIGDDQCRPNYKKVLIKYLKSYKASLCPDCQRRLKKNPLRVLDCKQEQCKLIISQAPQIIDYLCQECHNHFRAVLEFLDELQLPYRLNSYLVRGLDYYDRTVFEISEKNSENKGSLIGGGRYNGLVNLLKGKEMPACGMAGGVERIVNLMKEKNQKTSKSSNPKVFLVQLGMLAKRKSLTLIENFRKANIKIDESLGKDSLGQQLKRADRAGIKCALILGQKEALEDKIIIRDMKTGKQSFVKLSKVVKKIKEKLKKLN